MLAVPSALPRPASRMNTSSCGRTRSQQHYYNQGEMHWGKHHMCPFDPAVVPTEGCLGVWHWHTRGHPLTLEYSAIFPEAVISLFQTYNVHAGRAGVVVLAGAAIILSSNTVLARRTRERNHTWGKTCCCSRLPLSDDPSATCNPSCNLFGNPKAGHPHV